jgi:Carboxypeptidase regulatory-like domain/TonB-dependent Receptor Plug Domain
MVLFVVALSTSVFSQDTASLTGTVTDPTGAVIRDAQVIVQNPANGVHRVTGTNTTGEYLVDGLPPAPYDLVISAARFESFHANNIVLRVAQKARANAMLQIGTATAQTTVSGLDVAQVETQSSELAGTVTAKQITQLQLNGRDFTQLIALVPGVSNQGGEDQAEHFNFRSPFFSINGGRAEYNNWELDGGDMLDNGSNTFLNVNPSIDAIAEVRVLTSNYGAQYGRNGSATIETETKSGTNAFHGDVYEFVRNDVFNARNYFDPASDENGKPLGPPPYKKNDFGYTIGGPIYIPGIYNEKRDKSFFFWSEEWRRERVPVNSPIFAQVPSAAERMGDFSDLCPNAVTGSSADCPVDPYTRKPFPNNVVPVAFNAQFLLPLIPLPNGGTPGAETLTAVPPQTFNWREESIRLDHNFGAKLRAMFRLIHDSEVLILPNPFFGVGFPTVQTKIQVPGVSIVARLTANISSTVLNEFVFSYTTNHFSGANLGAWQRPPEATFGALFQNGFAGKLPGFGLGGSSAYNGGFGMDLGTAPWANSNPTYTYRDNLSKIVAGHSFHLGAYVVAAQKNEPNSAPLQGSMFFNASSKNSTGNPFADLLTGRIFNFSQTSRQIKYYHRYKILEPYVQDDWRVNGHLTLNLGFRFSLFGTYRDRSQQTYNFDPNAYNRATAPSIDPDTGALVFRPGSSINAMTGMVQCGRAGVPAGCVKGHLVNPAPRLGFAYDPTGTGKMAIRAAYGIFFEHTNGNEDNSESLEGSPPLVLSAQQFNILGYENIGKSNNPGLYFPLDVTSIPNQAVWPYVQQWHLDVQRRVTRKAVLTVAYVGAKGTHLTLQRDLNQILSLPLSLNPYKPGEPIGGQGGQHDDCGTMTTPSGVPVTGEAAIHLSIACGNNPAAVRPFVGFGIINRLEAAASSTYHALQASLRRDVGGLQFSVAYTYSHAVDDLSARFDGNFVDSYSFRSNRSSGNFDQRHILNVSYIYDLPFFKGAGTVSRFFGGWQLSGITTFQTGTPFSVTNNQRFEDNAGVANAVGSGSYADAIGDPNSAPATRLVEGIPGPLLFNPAAFAAPRGLTFGDSGRNFLRNPRRTNFDIALFKRFAVSEAKWFEFRTEAFNIFNHTQWAGINNGMSCYGGPSNSAADADCVATSNFLHSNSAHRSRILQLGVKFVF